MTKKRNKGSNDKKSKNNNTQNNPSSSEKEIKDSENKLKEEEARLRKEEQARLRALQEKEKKVSKIKKDLERKYQELQDLEQKKPREETMTSADALAVTLGNIDEGSSVKEFEFPVENLSLKGTKLFELNGTRYLVIDADKDEEWIKDNISLIKSDAERLNAMICTKE